MTETETTAPGQALIAKLATMAVHANYDVGYLVKARHPAAVVHVATNETYPSPPAPAWWDPAVGDIYVHLDRAGLRSLVDAVVPPSKDEAALRGLLTHEAAHSAWSTWHGHDFTTDPVVQAIITLFEELRIEWRVVKASESSFKYLRASLPIAIGNVRENMPTTRFAAARSWALIYGRVLAGVADAKELEWMDAAARTVLGDDDIDVLVDLLQEALTVEVEGPDDAVGGARMVAIATEWIEVTGRPPKDDIDPRGVEVVGCSGSGGAEASAPSDDGNEPTDGDEGESGKSVAPSDDEGEGGTKGAGNDDDEGEGGDDEPGVGGVGFSPEDGEVLAQALEDVIGKISEEWQSIPRETVLSDPIETARRVFGKGSRGGDAKDPKRDVRLRVQETTRALEQLTLPAVAKRVVPTQQPPGRLRTREAVRQSAERAQGMMSQAKPWRTTKRRHEEVRPIVLGIATDVSGSMRWAERAVAEFSFVWGNAGHRIGARTAAVTFGSRITAILGPGEVPAAVRTVGANAGNENFDEAVAALDGVLKLTVNNDCAKVLIVVSDGQFVRPGEPGRAVAWCERLKAGGTHVVWVTPTRSSLVMRLEKIGLATVVTLTRGVDNPEVLVHEAALRAIKEMR